MYDNNDLNNQTFGVENEQPQQEKTAQQPQAQAPQPQFVTYIPYGLTVETYLEKKAIKRTANVIGGSLLVFLFLAEIMSLIFTGTMSIIGFTNENIYNLIGDSAFNDFYHIISSSFLFIIPFIIIFKTSGFRIRNLIDFKRPKKGISFWLFLMGISFCAFSNIAVSIIGSLVEGFGVNYEVDFGDPAKGFFGFTISLISTAVIPPLVEEFACRGIILGALRKFGDSFAVIASAVVFGFLHGNFQQIPFAFLVGLVLGYVTVKSGSIWVAIFIHAFNNGLSVTVEKLLSVLPTDVCNVMYTIILIIVMILGLFSLFALKNKEFSFNFDKSSTASGEAQKNKWFFTSITIIIFTIICIINSLQYFV